jgi:cytidylate kinase
MMPVSSTLQLKKAILVTIDGPAGAGKTTVSKLLAEQLDYRYLDTGALYRAVAFGAMVSRIYTDDDMAMDIFLKKSRLTLLPAAKGFRLIWNDQNITDQLRTPEISMMASAVSAKPAVRNFLIGVQREIGQDKSLVCEGRDMGTIVFPDADIKFFLDANPEIRALRRYRELALCTSSITLDDVFQEMLERDRNDRQRAIAPLIPAPDAIIIDASSMGIPAVIHHMTTIIVSRFGSTDAKKTHQH